MTEPLGTQRHELLTHLRRYGRLAVAWSGGVDSTLLLRMAIEALGRDNALGIHVAGEVTPSEEGEAALALARSLDFPVHVVRFSMLAIEGFSANPPDRCYLCKKALFQHILSEARAKGFETLAEGSTLDDMTEDYRPGLRAVRELGVVSPLAELRWTKAAIRALARACGLPNWNKPSNACLASRFPYGTTITAERLDQVARAERILRERGFEQVRVRWHGSVARIEVAVDDIERLARGDVRAEVTAALRAIGFRYVALDLAGYRTGSLNEALGVAPRGAS